MAGIKAFLSETQFGEHSSEHETDTKIGNNNHVDVDTDVKTVISFKRSTKKKNLT